MQPKTPTALLIIDVQQGLCEGEHAAFECAQVVARINTVAQKARAAGVLVVSSSTNPPRATSNLKAANGDWPTACMQRPPT